MPFTDRLCMTVGLDIIYKKFTKITGNSIHHVLLFQNRYYRYAKIGQVFTSMFIQSTTLLGTAKVIYDAFHGYMYGMTVELDITEFLEKIHESHWKFYPSM